MTKKYEDFDLAIPVYCNFYKNLLIEELLFVDNPAILHYGMCSVIGRLVRGDDDPNSFFLENIKMKFLEKCYQLDNGFCKLPLLTVKRPTAINRYVEIFGEVVLNESIKPDDAQLTNNIIPKTSKELMAELINAQLIFNDTAEPPVTGRQQRFYRIRLKLKSQLEKLLTEFEQRYEAAVQVHHTMVIDDAEELIRINLATNHLKERIKKFKFNI